MTKKILISLTAAAGLTTAALTTSALADGDKPLPPPWRLPDDKAEEQRSSAMTLYQQFRNIDLEGITETIEWKTDPATIAWLKNNNRDENENESHIIRKNYRYALKLRDGIGTITYYKIKDPDCTMSNAATTGVPIVRNASVYVSIENGNHQYDTLVRLKVDGPEASFGTDPDVNEVLNGGFDLPSGGYAPGVL